MACWAKAVRTVYQAYQLFKNCIIEGSVDFIFGGAESYFDDCEFCSIEKVSFFALNTPEGADDASRPSWIKVTNKMEVE